MSGVTNRVRTRIKVCGIKDSAGDASRRRPGADAIGFILVPKLPRTIEPEDAAAIMYALPPMVNSVGVVRDLSVDEFATSSSGAPAS
jgi:phosphoribosylanthranilate isomerase